MGNFREVTAFESRVRYVEKTVDHSVLTASMTEQVDFDAALPADAFVLGGELNVTEAFTSGGGAFSADLGYDTTDTDGIVDGAAANLETIAHVGAPRGVLVGTRAGGELPAISFTSDVNLSTATAGIVTARLYFIQLDFLKPD